MKSNQFFGILLFIAGLVLSLITNLLTGDEEVISFYNNYKKEVLYWGIGLTALSVILTFVMEAPSKNDQGPNSRSSGSSSRYLIKVVGAILSSVLIGLFSGLLVFWGLHLFSVDENIILLVATILSGAIVGVRFDHLGTGELTGILLGGFLGFASTYYFTAELPVEFLPDWLAKKPIIVSTLIAGVIGSFTAPHKISAERRSAQRSLENRKKLELFEVATAKLKMRGWEVKATSATESFFQLLGHNVDADQVKKIEDTKIVGYGSIGNWVDKLEVLPQPPYLVFDQHGNEIQRFKSLEAFIKFSESAL